MPSTLAASWTTKLVARALTPEGMLGFAGCAIACASGSFALYMTMHGPLSNRPASSYFTVFAQLAPRTSRPDMVSARMPTVPAADDIDPVVTGSIPHGSKRLEAVKPVLENMLLRQVDGNNALIEVNDSLAVYTIGDLIPGAGRLMAMTRQNGRPALETSKGLIVEAR